MSNCLYDCLKEAGLEKFHESLQNNGFNTAFSLLHIPATDLVNIGINTDSERQRFLQLIQIIDSFHKINLQTRSNPSTIQDNFQDSNSPHVAKKSFRGSPSVDSNGVNSSRNVQIETGEISRNVSTRQSLSSNKSNNMQTENLNLPTRNVNIMRSSSDLGGNFTKPETGALEIHRILHSGSYNYGLPDKRRESKERKQRDYLFYFSPKSDGNYYNLSSKKITVCVRKRPLLSFEISNNIFDVITTNKQGGGVKGQIVVHELKQKVDLKEFVKQNAFLFDHVFDENSTNENLFQDACKPLINFVMTRTHRATCFCYGQTGAGKSHTLLGSESEPGLFLFAAQDMLKQIHLLNTSQENHLTLWISLYEIYCGKIFDLLNNQKKLLALEDSNKQVHINGLRQIQVKDVNTLMQLLDNGLKSRSVGVTATNADSSRSHAILQLVLKDNNHKEYSRFSFIDLAGSERACDALRNSDKQNRLEGAEINQSLLALKECIRSLDQFQAHTPFRQSKLTQVLRDSFIGKSKTCMIANVSPAHNSLDHTMNTLRYASRVKDLRKNRLSSATPKRKRSRDVWSEKRRPQTAAVTRSKPMVARTPTSRDIQRSLSIKDSLDTSDNSVFKGQGLARTPPLLSPVESINVEESLPTMKPAAVFRQNPLFTPEHMQGSSTPLRSQTRNSRKNVDDNKVQATNSVSSSNSVSSTTQTVMTESNTAQLIRVSQGQTNIVSNSSDSNTQSAEMATQKVSNDTMELPNVVESVEVPDTTVQEAVSLAQSSSTIAMASSLPFDDCSDKQSSSSGHSMHVDIDDSISYKMPQSKNNTGLPSPKKFLTYLKGRQSIKTKELQKQLKSNRQSEIQLDSDTNSEATDKTNEDSLPSTSILRPMYNPTTKATSSLAQNEKSKHPSTPPRLPSPKLDSSLPQRSSRILESDSPGSTGGVSTPNKENTTPTNTSLKSASDFHNRLMEAFVDDRKAGSGNRGDSSHRRVRASRTQNFSKKEKLHKAQSEVVIAHQEHISEILRVSIDEERLYHNLREGWEGGVSFRYYTAELQKLLSTKIASIEALKAQLAMYEKIEKSFEDDPSN